MILRDVMGWQGGLLTMSLAVVYFSVVFLINLISVPKIELCFIFVGGRSWLSNLIICVNC